MQREKARKKHKDRLKGMMDPLYDSGSSIQSKKKEDDDDFSSDDEEEKSIF